MSFSISPSFIPKATQRWVLRRAAIRPSPGTTQDDWYNTSIPSLLGGGKSLSVWVQPLRLGYNPPLSTHPPLRLCIYTQRFESLVELLNRPPYLLISLSQTLYLRKRGGASGEERAGRIGATSKRVASEGRVNYVRYSSICRFAPGSSSNFSPSEKPRVVNYPVQPAQAEAAQPRHDAHAHGGLLLTRLVSGLATTCEEGRKKGVSRGAQHFIFYENTAHCHYNPPHPPPPCCRFAPALT